jgi:hypothetical protein
MGSFYQEGTTGLRIREPGELPSSVDNICLTRNGLGSHSHGPWEHDGIVSHSVLCTSCGLEQRITSGRSEIGQTKQTNNLSSSSEDQMISNSVLRSQEFDALSVALANRVLALLDLPSNGQPHSMAGAVEQSPSMQASDFVRCYTEAALRKYTDEGDFSSFSEEWGASHPTLEFTPLDTLSAEMTAPDEEAIDFDLFYKGHLSARLDDTLIQTLSAELNEYDSAIADTCARGSHFTFCAQVQSGGHSWLKWCSQNLQGIGR